VGAARSLLASPRVAGRLAIVALLALTLVPSALRAFAARPVPPRRCVPEGRGIEPRIWIGCAGDEGPPRGLFGPERLVLGLRVDVNAAAVDDLAAVPGLSPRLAAAIVAERARAGPYEDLDGLLRVRGIGPARLERARPHLECGR
jgi:competence protein ComEA